MALNETQTAALAEMIGETYDATKAALDSLARIYTAGQATAIEAAVVADLAVWATVKDKHLKVGGGRDGVDLDYERNRSALRRRNRKRLGLPTWSEDDLALDSSAVRPALLRGGGWL